MAPCSSSSGFPHLGRICGHYGRTGEEVGKDAVPERLGALAAAAPSRAALDRELRALADPDLARGKAGFYQTGPGGYGEGDRFLGIPVPAMREVARRHRGLALPEVARLLRGRYHEQRFVALVILGLRYQRAGETEREAIVCLYRREIVHIDNWDLVDLSAPRILGEHLVARPRDVLDLLARSTSVWERRVAIVATLALIRRGDLATTFRLARRLMADPHDLIHKAVGWMLREAGHRDRARLEAFLDANAARMPRTMLRYAIEAFPERRRRAYLDVEKLAP